MASSKQEVIEKMRSHLNSLFACGGQPSSWEQGSYNSDLWEIFEESQAIDLHGDPIYLALYELLDDDRQEEKSKVLSEMCKAMDEWRYALAKRNLK